MKTINQKAGFRRVAASSMLQSMQWGTVGSLGSSLPPTSRCTQKARGRGGTTHVEYGPRADCACVGGEQCLVTLDRTDGYQKMDGGGPAGISGKGWQGYVGTRGPVPK